jgi:cell wall-associated NlpC family hydrolase
MNGRTIGYVWAAVLCTDAAWAQIPYKTRADILRYAATGVGSAYIWGGGNWDPNDRSYGGADCSGFVSKS